MGYEIWDMGYGIWDMGYGIGIWDCWDLGWDGIGTASLVLIGKCTRIIYFTIDCKNVGGYLFLGSYEEFLSWREIVDLLVSNRSYKLSLIHGQNQFNLPSPNQFNLFPSTTHPLPSSLLSLLSPEIISSLDFTFSDIYALQHLKIEEYHYT
ncbi:unnamed protein product [Rhizophagus irregularis]|nr:unnamed protein product [Rhizophagus irregularis]